jgi:uncharacterized OB-fold protein
MIYINKTVSYVNERSEDEVVVAIRLKYGDELVSSIDELKKSRTEYGLKVQRIIDKLKRGD